MTPKNDNSADGEGGNIGGRHEYLLLRAGNHCLETGTPLEYSDVLPFLAGLPTDSEYVSFFFDYDVTMFLRSLPPERILRLLDRQGRTCVLSRKVLDEYQAAGWTISKFGHVGTGQTAGPCARCGHGTIRYGVARLSHRVSCCVT